MPLKSWKQLKADAGDAGQSFEPLPDNTYDFVIEAAEHRTSQSGKDGFNVTAVVESGPYKGRKVFNTFWVSPDSPTALGIFFRQFGALGLGDDFFAQDPGNEQIVSALAKKRFRGTTRISEWNGNKRNELANVEKPNPAAPSVSLDDVAAHATVSNTPSPGTAAPSVTVPSAGSAAPASDNPWAGASVPSVPSGAPERPF